MPVPNPVPCGSVNSTTGHSQRRHIMTHHQPLIYRTLDDDAGEIRLLTIRASRSRPRDFECRLDHVKIDLLPTYDALSYCWGEPTDTRAMTVNGMRFNATTSLHAALSHLHSRGVRKLWVDAVCINQADLAEKSKQLVMMESIYRKATVVRAWLGPEDDESASVVDTITRYGSRAIPAVAQSGPTESQLTSLVNFLSRAYWSRVWIIQEVVLAQNLVLHLGQRTIKWNELVDAVTRILKEAEMSAIERDLGGLSRLRREVAKGQIPLMRALRETWRAKASDPRDKVYGLLGLVEDQRNFITKPKYGASLRRLNSAMVLE